MDDKNEINGDRLKKQQKCYEVVLGTIWSSITDRSTALLIRTKTFIRMCSFRSMRVSVDFQPMVECVWMIVAPPSFCLGSMGTRTEGIKTACDTETVLQPQNDNSQPEAEIYFFFTHKVVVGLEYNLAQLQTAPVPLWPNVPDFTTQQEGGWRQVKTREGQRKPK